MTSLRLALVVLFLAACTTSRVLDPDGGHDDGAAPDMHCSSMLCPSIPLGCTHVDDGSCCGTYTCMDAGCPLPPCAAPPLGCHYEGAGCGTCGTIVCADAGCAIPDCGIVPMGCFYPDPCTCADLTCPGAMPDCRSTGCATGETCRPCGVPGPGGIPYSCVADGVVCGL